MLTRVAQSPFVLKCNQRVYESMISTLYKFPWAATQTYTVAARNALFQAARKLLSVLVKKVGTFTPSTSTGIVPYNSTSSKNQGYNQAYPPSGDTYPQSSQYNRPAPDQREVGLSQPLLFDLLFAALNVPAFSLSQKFELCQVVGPIGRGVPLSHFAETWPFQTLTPGRNVSDQVTQFWLQLFDSGFDMIDTDGTGTTYEHYINFSRNKDGFPVAELTQAGIELPFEDGIRVEFGAMMVYLCRGRGRWADERGLMIKKWQANSLMDLMEIIAREKEAGQHFERGEPKLRSHYNSTISPSTTEFERQGSAVANNAGSTTTTQGAHLQLNRVDSAQNTKSKFNPATAKDFIPASTSNLSVTEAATNNVYSAFKSIWSDPPVVAAPPSQATHVTIAPNVAATVATRGTSDWNMQSDIRAATNFRNPFAPPSSTVQGFSQDARRDSARPSIGVWADTFKPLQQQRKSEASNIGSASPLTTTQDSLSYPQHSPFTRRESATSVGDSMRQLSLAMASRNASTDNTYTSASTLNDPLTATTSASSYHNPSFAVNEQGSPAPKVVQKYPNVTYSTMQQGHNESPATFNQYGSRSTADQARTQAQAQAQGQGRVMSTTSPSRMTPALPLYQKVRAQSTPFAAIGQRGLANVATQSQFQSSGVEKNDTPPATIVAAVPSAAGENSGSATHTGLDNNTSTVTAQKDTGEGSIQLSANELWNEVRGFK